MGEQNAHDTYRTTTGVSPPQCALKISKCTPSPSLSPTPSPFATDPPLELEKMKRNER